MNRPVGMLYFKVTDSSGLAKLQITTDNAWNGADGIAIFRMPDSFAFSYGPFSQYAS